MRAKDARFEAPEAPMEWSVGRGCPLPTEEGLCPSPEIKKKFGSMCSKNFCVQAKGGASPSAPLNTPLVMSNKGPVTPR